MCNEKIDSETERERGRDGERDGGREGTRLLETERDACCHGIGRYLKQIHCTHVCIERESAPTRARASKREEVSEREKRKERGIPAELVTSLMPRQVLNDLRIQLEQIALLRRRHCRTHTTLPHTTSHYPTFTHALSKCTRHHPLSCCARSPVRTLQAFLNREDFVFLRCLSPKLAGLEGCVEKTRTAGISRNKTWCSSSWRQSTRPRRPRPRRPRPRHTSSPALCLCPRPSSRCPLCAVFRQRTAAAAILLLPVPAACRAAGGARAGVAVLLLQPRLAACLTSFFGMCCVRC
jgi:hypothetical protein